MGVVYVTVKQPAVDGVNKPLVALIEPPPLTDHVPPVFPPVWMNVTSPPPIHALTVIIVGVVQDTGIGFTVKKSLTAEAKAGVPPLTEAVNCLIPAVLICKLLYVTTPSPPPPLLPMFKDVVPDKVPSPEVLVITTSLLFPKPLVTGCPN
ncbi:hypothetical protein FEDK69T_18240 [Flavobacterium enshiense DK69]|nr:hypothetical protein FEDK69T_18240 [Flavobacterium enshiense DK69]